METEENELQGEWGISAIDDADYVPLPPNIYREGASHMSAQVEFEMNYYRNGHVVDGVPVPEPQEIVFDVYKRLVIEESSFTRGNITDVPTYVQAHGVIHFMQETNYKYSLGCLFLYPAIAQAQRQFVQKAVFGL